MTTEHIHDALNYLPDDLLESTDRLRQKKRIPWKSITALAACACLVAGLWYFAPGSAEKSIGATPEIGMLNELDAESCVADSAGLPYITAQITEVETDKIWVTTADSEEAVPVYLDSLEEIPILEAGQVLRIYCDPAADGGSGSSHPGLHPYKIEIEEN